MMGIHYSQYFLLIYMIIYFSYYLSTYARVEPKHEKSIDEKYGKARITKIIGSIFGLIILLWIVIIIVYFFAYDFINWFWKIPLLDNDFVKIIAMIIMCIGLLLSFTFTRTVGKSIKEAVNSEEKPQLITTGIYHYIRHPAYTAVILSLIGTFLIIPNVFMLIFLLGGIFVIINQKKENLKFVIF